VKYVYDRMKLLALTPEAKKLFLGGTLTAGHAILLARLGAKDQARALKVGAALRTERTLFDPEADDDAQEDTVTSVSVREFEAWIDEHVRFDAKEPDPMLFPETASAIAEAKKIVPITYLHFIREEARDGRTWGPKSWKRADGLKKSKTCDHAVTGFIAVGPHRGEAFPVCIAKEKCAIHWPQARASAKRAAKAHATAGSPEKPTPLKLDPYEIRRHQRDELQKRWVKARPSMLQVIAERIMKVSASSGSTLGEILLRNLRENGGGSESAPIIPRGKTAEDLVRHLAGIVAYRTAHEYNFEDALPRLAKTLGLDPAAILKREAPAQTSAKPAGSKKKKTTKKPAKRRGAKKS